MLPNARKDRLIVQELGEETVVYDEERDRVHRLNHTAELVWNRCDGRTSIAEMAARLGSESDTPASEEVVWLALDRLDKAHLLQERLIRPEDLKFITRRQAIRKAALVGGISLLLPVVQSMVAPTPAMAASIGCSGIGRVPSLTHPCCPGLRVIRGRCYGHGVG